MNQRKVTATAFKSINLPPPPNTQTDHECDINTDTYFLGNNFVILDYTTITVVVYANYKPYKPLW